MQLEKPRRLTFQSRAGAASIKTLAKVTRYTSAADIDENRSITALKSLADMVVPLSGEGPPPLETPLAASAALIKQIVA